MLKVEGRSFRLSVAYLYLLQLHEFTALGDAFRKRKVEFGYIIDNFRLKQSLHCIVIASYANALMTTMLCYILLCKREFGALRRVQMSNMNLNLFNDAILNYSGYLAAYLQIVLVDQHQKQVCHLMSCSTNMRDTE